ncbi:MAG: hypothetical protein AUK44_07170 [Porphyromonadaceae bacterium CG2_30_38_12]|nr:MAG: hypothetical protein AUK44_07170 [Porphyromonadaceae bacterium CG2_30_38_12]
MIQRIQTVYLLAVIILSIITLLSVQASFLGNSDAANYILSYKGIFQVQPTGNEFVKSVWALTALCTLIPFVAVLSIFVYKKRLLQIRLSIINSVLLVGYYGLLFIYLWQASTALDANWHLKMVAAFPLVNIVLTFLAIRAIGKDEALIKSLHRLR